MKISRKSQAKFDEKAGLPPGLDVISVKKQKITAILQYNCTFTVYI
jgi:hypothetical protein